MRRSLLASSLRVVFMGLKSAAPTVAVNSTGTTTGGPDVCGVRACVAHKQNCQTLASVAFTKQEQLPCQRSLQSRHSSYKHAEELVFEDCRKEGELGTGPTISLMDWVCIFNNHNQGFAGHPFHQIDSRWGHPL